MLIVWNLLVDHMRKAALNVVWYLHFYSFYCALIRLEGQTFIYTLASAGRYHDIDLFMVFTLFSIDSFIRR